MAWYSKLNRKTEAQIPSERVIKAHRRNKIYANNAAEKLGTSRRECERSVRKIKQDMFDIYFKDYLPLINQRRSPSPKPRNSQTKINETLPSIKNSVNSHNIPKLKLAGISNNQDDNSTERSGLKFTDRFPLLTQRESFEHVMSSHGVNSSRENYALPPVNNHEKKTETGYTDVSNGFETTRLLFKARKKRGVFVYSRKYAPPSLLDAAMHRHATEER